MGVVVPDRTLAEPELADDVESAEVEFAADCPVVAVLARLSTVLAAGMPPVPLAVGDNNVSPADAVVPAPAPEDEPAVFDVTVVLLPLWED